MLRSTIKWLVDALNRLNTALVLPALLSLILWDISLRVFFSSSLAWAHEVSGLLLITMFFLAIPKCIEQDELLRVDLIYQRLSRKKQNLLRIVGHTCLLFFSVLVIWQAALGARDSYEYQDRAYTIDIPYWPFYSMMLFIGLVTTLQSIELFWGEVRDFFRKSPAPRGRP